jgi:hypothetical protein
MGVRPVSFVIITLDGAQIAVGSQPPVGQSQIVVAGNDPTLLPQPVNRDNPLPIGAYYGVSGKPAIGFNFQAPGEVSPVLFAPIAGRPFNVTLDFSGDVDGVVMQLIRSFDNGATWVGLTAEGQPVGSWVADASETFLETEVGVKYALKMVERNAGSVQTRISQ